MNFVERIFDQLQSAGDHPSIIEVRGTAKVPTSAAKLFDQIQTFRRFLRSRGVGAGDRVALLAPNSSTWVACDLAILSEGAIVVPLYARQDPKELAFMVQDTKPVLVIASDEILAMALKNELHDACPVFTFAQGLDCDRVHDRPFILQPSDPATIIYTSGTSSLPKGVVLNIGNIDFMLARTMASLREATGRANGEDRVFHFLPVCFAGSRIAMWTQLLRMNPLMFSTDLTNLAQEMKTASPEYFLTVPAVLEKIRTGVREKIQEKGGWVWNVYRKRQSGIHSLLAKMLVFPKIKERIGENLKFIICGSAALGEETQRWFEAIGIPIYQVYGLTETTAIVTMDRPSSAVAGRVGEPIEGCETKITEEGELIVRGPNVFPGYWDRKEETKAVLRNGWLHTGDQAEFDTRGRLKIVGRVKSVVIPASGHNIAPEPIEQMFLDACPDAEHAVVIGHGRPYLSLLVTGKADEDEISKAVEVINAKLPHYRKIRKFYRYEEGFSIENGMLTANQKLKRKHIENVLVEPIEQLYQTESSA